jgi:hypothetical protein
MSGALAPLLGSSHFSSCFFEGARVKATAASLAAHRFHPDKPVKEVDELPAFGLSKVETGAVGATHERFISSDVAQGEILQRKTGVAMCCLRARHPADRALASCGQRKKAARRESKSAGRSQPPRGAYPWRSAVRLGLHKLQHPCEKAQYGWVYRTRTISYTLRNVGTSQPCCGHRQTGFTAALCDVRLARCALQLSAVLRLPARVLPALRDVPLPRLPVSPPGVPERDGFERAREEGPGSPAVRGPRLPPRIGGKRAAAG